MDLYPVTSHLFLQPDKFTLPSACPWPLILWLPAIDYVNVYFFICGKLCSPPTILFATLNTYISESLCIIVRKYFSSPEYVDVCVGELYSLHVLEQYSFPGQMGKTGW